MTIINDILDVSKIEARRLTLEHVPFAVRDTIEDSVKLLAPRADQKGLELSCRIAPDVPATLAGDPGRLRQILINLVGNAIKFTDSGEVGVEVTVAERSDDEVLLRSTVRDTGIGIPEDKRWQIFGAFVQADASTTRRYGGSGLGLTISSQLIEMMGGRLWLESEPGVGSQFHFVVRLDVPEHVDAVPAARVRLADDPRARGRRQRHQPAHPRRDSRELADGGGGRGDGRRGARRAPRRGCRRPAVSSGADRCAHARRRRLYAGRADRGRRSGEGGRRSCCSRRRDYRRSRRGVPRSSRRRWSNPSSSRNCSMRSSRPSRRRTRLGAGGEDGAPAAASRACPPRAGGRGQSDEPDARLCPARSAGPPRGDREQRASRRGTRGAGAVRPHSDGRADAGDERTRGDRGDPRGRTAHRRSYPDRGAHRPRHDRRPRTVSGRRNGRLRPQAGASGRTVRGHRRDRRFAGVCCAVTGGSGPVAGSEERRLGRPLGPAGRFWRPRRSRQESDRRVSHRRAGHARLASTRPRGPRTLRTWPRPLTPSRARRDCSHRARRTPTHARWNSAHGAAISRGAIARARPSSEACRD